MPKSVCAMCFYMSAIDHRLMSNLPYVALLLICHWCLKVIECSISLLTWEKSVLFVWLMIKPGCPDQPSTMCEIADLSMVIQFSFHRFTLLSQNHFRSLHEPKAKAPARWQIRAALPWLGEVKNNPGPVCLRCFVTNWKEPVACGFNKLGLILRKIAYQGAYCNSVYRVLFQP